MVTAKMDKTMNREVSLYLDIVRITAAMVVFLGHAAGPLTHGFLWQLNSYLDAAVMIFFILSGFVIAFVADTKEKTFNSYVIARVSRLSSIVVPALVITVIADQIGLFVNADLYYGGPWGAPKNDLLNYILSLFLVQNVWHLSMQPGMNSPFWSLSFELMFYAMFAAAFYFRGKKRYVILILLIMASGPDILFLFPIWILGMLSYYVLKHYSSFFTSRKYISIFLSVLSLLLLIFGSPWIQANVKFDIPFLMANRSFVADYCYAILFTIHLLTVSQLLNFSLIKNVLNRFSKFIVFMGSMTFALYLFHRPLIQMFATFSDDPASIQNRLLVLGGTMIVVLTAGRWCENSKYWIKKILVNKFGENHIQVNSIKK